MAETRNPTGAGRPETLLDEAFALARSDAARPAPEALLARVLADAGAACPAPPPAIVRRGPGPFARFLAALGGWPALGGLATAGITGFWLGIAPPASVEDLGLWSGTASLSAGFLPDDYVADVSEG